MFKPLKTRGFFLPFSVITLHNINYRTIKNHARNGKYILTFFMNIKKYLTKSVTILMKFEFLTN